MATSRRRIRPVSRETRFLRLRGLKCFKDVHQRIHDGWGTTRLAQYIQKECGEYTDITQDSLEHQLTEYRDALPKGEVVRSVMPEFYANASKKVEEGFDSLAEMKSLYKIQMERIQIDLVHERNMKKLMPQTMTQEMRAAREILHDIADLEMDLGLNKRHLGQIDVQAQVISDVTSRYDSSVSKAMEQPASRRKLLGIADRFLSLASGEANIEEEAQVEAPEPEPESVSSPPPAEAPEP